MLCNKPYSGTAVIDDFGELHLKTGDLIVYTSADSVLQIAAHVDQRPARRGLRGLRRGARDHAGRACGGARDRAAVPGEPGRFERTEGRKDLALPPPGRSYLEELQADGIATHTAGKIGQVFAGVGVDHQHKGSTNAKAIDATTALIEELDGGFVFTNLVETDQVYGHRQDVEGFHGALRAIDAAVGTGWEKLDPARDLLALTADHGCDPTTPGTDHSREHVPLLASFEGQATGAATTARSRTSACPSWRWPSGRDASGAARRASFGAGRRLAALAALLSASSGAADRAATAAPAAPAAARHAGPRSRPSAEEQLACAARAP